ncbi:MAG TPA: 5-oxoprolinase subunit PxpA [Verrucomicrobiae bacterium]|nr:5-oxoprolinase subunit PxpA [Verrucomicrobiae bacterium]
MNCDLGEGEPSALTRALMRCVTSANVACGGHAGDLDTMAACVGLAKQFGVRLGAHPGPWSRGDFGRGPLRLAARELELLLVHQVGALERLARREYVRLRHIKLHGALYHASESDESIARAYLAAVRAWWPRCVVFARAGGRVARLARRAGVRVWEEAYLDRGYREDGTLVPRDAPGALLDNERSVKQRLERLIVDGVIETVSIRPLKLRPKTLCLHSDIPKAVQFARLARRALDL